MPFRQLRSDKITKTLEALTQRIEERFPGSGLGKIGAELGNLSTVSDARAAALLLPNVPLRLAVGLGVLVSLAGVVALALSLPLRLASDDLSGVLQGAEAMLQIVVFAGAAVFFLVSFEDRQKRKGALTHLHELRSIVHVIDMHQLTKDPSALMTSGPKTASSPERALTPFELVRYLNYSSEMLSLSSKIAAIYSQASRDAVVGASVNEIEQLTTNLCGKIWQKIRLVEDIRQNEEAARRALPRSAVPAVMPKAQ